MRPSVRGVRVLLAVCLSLSWARALAQTPPGDDTTARARRLYEEANRHYDLREYDEAIEACRAGYELMPLPEFLFNIAQAYRLKGDCVEALSFYRNYLRASPAARNRAKVEAFIAEMQRCVPAPVPVVSPPTTPQAPAPSTRMPPVRVVAPRESPAAEGAPHGRSKRIFGLLVAGAGVAVLGTGLYYGLDARAKSDEVATFFERGGMWTARYQALESDGQSAATRAKILGVAGGAALVGGALLYALGWREGSEAPALAAAPLGGGAWVSWCSAF